MQSSDADTITLATILAPGIAAVRRYWKPFLLLHASALLLVIAYYTSAQVRQICAQLADVKHHGELVFSAITAALAGALLPELAKAIMLGDRTLDRKRLNDITFHLAIFALSGVIVDVQYHLTALLLGDHADLKTVIKKILFDQCVTTPIYGTPYWLVMFSLRAHRFNPIATVREFSPRWYKQKVLPLLIPGWAFWTPMVALIYSLPGPLQFCLYCFALAAWSLLMVFVAKVETNPAAIE
jgi:hypothetical protein